MPTRAPRGALNQQFLNSLNWKLALNAIRSNDLKGMMTQMEMNTDPDDRYSRLDESYDSWSQG